MSEDKSKKEIEGVNTPPVEEPPLLSKRKKKSLPFMT